MRRSEILFCSDFPLAYHNPEAEERVARLADRGHRVVYVATMGIRDPQPRHLKRFLRALAPGREGAVADARGPVELVSPKMLPPRRAPGIAGFNRRWLTRQLISRLRDPSDAIMWIRFPSPELVHVVDACRPRLLVYELVDDHWQTMNTRAYRRLYREAEGALLERAGLVLANADSIRERLDTLRPGTLRFQAAAVDLERFTAPAKRGTEPEPKTALYIGGVDRRIDVHLVAETARRMPDWRFIVAGPVESEEMRVLRVVDNLVLPGRIPPADAPALIASAAVCLMPYVKNEFSRGIFPVKLVHYLAVGRPVAAVPIEPVVPYGDVVEFGEGVEAFSAAILRAAAADDEPARAARRQRVAEFDWENRLDKLEGYLDGASQAEFAYGRS